jgi:hypothetical protein
LFVNKVLVIQRSLHCFVLGLISLVPLLGLPLAIRALQLYWQVKADVGQDWNPADVYCLWGGRLAFWGCVLAVLTCFGIAILVWLGG